MPLPCLCMAALFGCLALYSPISVALLIGIKFRFLAPPLMVFITAGQGSRLLIQNSTMPMNFKKPMQSSICNTFRQTRENTSH